MLCFACFIPVAKFSTRIKTRTQAGEFILTGSEVHVVEHERPEDAVGEAEDLQSVEAPPEEARHPAAVARSTHCAKQNSDSSTATEVVKDVTADSIQQRLRDCVSDTRTTVMEVGVF